MKRGWRYLSSASFMIIFITIVGASVTYTALSMGLFDHLYIALTRTQVEQRLRLAENSQPPDTREVVTAILGADWFIATKGAEAAERLAQRTDIGERERRQILQSLMTTLSSGGHWWRFGWDRSEPEYSQFLGAAESAVARFGAQAYPFLLVGLDSKSAHSQETSCWIILTMLKSQGLPSDSLKSDLLTRVRLHASLETSQSVREACQRALNAIPEAEQE